MKKNDTVCIRKVAAAENPLAPTPRKEEHVAGAENPGLSLPVAYEIEAQLLEDVVIGEAMRAFRYKRNGVAVPGMFESSAVMEIEPGEERTVVKTANSVYEVLPLSPTLWLYQRRESTFDI